MIRHIATLFLTTLLTTAASADTRTVLALEQAIESTTASLNLPGKLPGAIAIAPCSEGCVPLRLEITATTQFFVDRQAVQFVELQKVSEKTGLNVAVFYQPKSKLVTRIVVSDPKQ